MREREGIGRDGEMQRERDVSGEMETDREREREMCQEKGIMREREGIGRKEERRRKREREKIREMWER